MYILLLFSMYCYNKTYPCIQVEFNKAAQSLTDAVVPTAQRKTALNRLVKVGWFDVFYIVLSPLAIQN